MLNMAELAPMPSASATTAIRVNPGDVSHVRTPWRKSCARDPMTLNTQCALGQFRQTRVLPRAPGQNPLNVLPVPRRRICELSRRGPVTVHAGDFRNPDRVLLWLVTS